MISFFKNNRKMMTYAGLFLFTILIHWLIMGIAFILYNNPDGGSIFKQFYDRYAACGDASHYLNIAEHGYYADGEFANQIVFYPLYPLLMKIVSFVTGSYFVAGVLISDICLGISACFMYRLTAKELDESRAFDSVAIYLVYPFSVFLVAVFTESLFIMLVVMCLTYIKDKKWIIAGIVGMLAALTKSQGIALFVPAMYEAVVYMLENRRFKVKCLGTLIVPVGTIIYLIINKVVQGDYFAFVAHEEAEPWYNTAKWISVNLDTQYNMAIGDGYLSIIIYWAQIILYFLGIIALFYGLHKKISPSIIAYGGAYMFLSFLHGWLISGPRYMMSCVTLYVVYAAIDNRYVKNAILVVSGIFVIFYTLGSWQGQAIM